MAPVPQFLRFLTTLGSKTEFLVQNAPGLCFVGPREAIFSHLEQKSAKVLKNAQNAQKVILGPKMDFGAKSEKKCIFAFLRFLTSGAFIWAYYSKVSCVLAEASELLQKFCRVALL